MAFEIKGKVALVTGGASGIGFCCVKEILKHEAKGIAFIDTNSEKGQEALNIVAKEFGSNRCMFIESDVTLPEHFEEAFEQTIKRFKQLDIVVNNAGIVNERDWQKCVAVNLGGCITGTKLALEKYLPLHKSDKDGVVVNVSSIYGLDGLFLCPIYSATKHGVTGLSRSYGAEKFYKKTNVKVIALCPGVTSTPILEVSDEQRTTTSQQEVLEFVMQTPEHVAENLVKVIQEGTSGSVWVVKDGEPTYEVKFSKIF